MLNYRASGDGLVVHRGFLIGGEEPGNAPL